MTQVEIDHAVANSTGEDIREIAHRGFSIADPDEVCFDPEPDSRPPQMIDWDQFDLERNTAILARAV